MSALGVEFFCTFFCWKIMNQKFRRDIKMLKLNVLSKLNNTIEYEIDDELVKKTIDDFSNFIVMAIWNIRFNIKKECL